MLGGHREEKDESGREKEKGTETDGERKREEGEEQSHGMRRVDHLPNLSL